MTDILSNDLKKIGTALHRLLSDPDNPRTWKKVKFSQDIFIRDPKELEAFQQQHKNLLWIFGGVFDEKGIPVTFNTRIIIPETIDIKPMEAAVKQLKVRINSC